MKSVVVFVVVVEVVLSCRVVYLSSVLCQDVSVHFPWEFPQCLTSVVFNVVLISNTVEFRKENMFIETGQMNVRAGFHPHHQLPSDMSVY